MTQSDAMDLNHMPCLLREAIDNSISKSDQPGTNLKFPGVTTTYSFRGSAASIFAFHTTDMLLYSINVLLSGKPKLWYLIRPSDHDTAVSAIREHLRHSESYTRIGCSI